MCACRAPCGVLCMDISTDYPHLVVAGLYDGNVAVYNLCRWLCNSLFWICREIVKTLNKISMTPRDALFMCIDKVIV